MKVTKINIPFDEVEKILHFADIHIRLNSRHDEYKKVLSELYVAARKLPDKSIIVCCGDILHQKVNLSPEAVELATEMLKTLCEIRPTIVIPGNHDALVNNKARLDSLSPIINMINSPSLFYLKSSGLYGAGNLLFNHFSALEDREKYILDKDIPSSIKSKYKKIIGLYHGPVCGMTTDMGHLINDIKVTPEMFDGQNFALLGDIHAQQNVYIKKDIEDNELEAYKKKGWEVIT